MNRGIGPFYSKKLVGAFGEQVFDVIDQETDRLREVPGIGSERVQRNTDAWAPRSASGHSADRRANCPIDNRCASVIPGVDAQTVQKAGMPETVISNVDPVG